MSSLKEVAKKTCRSVIRSWCSRTYHQENISEFISRLKQRRVEVAMRCVPQKIKEIKHNALNTVFANEVQGLDQQSREILEKVINYMEKSTSAYSW